MYQKDASEEKWRAEKDKRAEEREAMDREVMLEAALAAMEGILAGRQGEMDRTILVTRAWNLADEFTKEYRKRFPNP